MAKQSIQTKVFDNGLVLLAESMDWLESAACALLLPAGFTRDPVGQFGIANFTCEMIQRGCADMSNREFSEALENNGIDRSSSVSTTHASYGAAMPADKLAAGLSLIADMVRRPHLAEDQLEEGRMVCFQEIRGMEDDLAQKVMLELRRRRYADPYGRHAQGTMESVQGITIDQIRSFYQSCYHPSGAILSVAGKIDFDQLVDDVNRLFGDWTSLELPEIQETEPDPSYHHIEHDSSQTHIGISYPSVWYSHPDYYQARGAVGVLSDGMSSRLFTEVREKRGLCYSVYAMCHSLRDRGSVLCYAGTTTEQAQETVDVMIAELERLPEGIEDDELQRLKAKIKSSLIMQQESSAARSGSMAADWYFLGRIQTLDEIGATIDALSCDSINDYLAKQPPRNFSVVTLGAKQLEMPGGVL